MIYRAMPERYKRKVKEMLENAGSKKSPKGFTNASFIISILLGLVIGFFTGELFLLVFVLVFAGIFSLLHGLVFLAIERRAHFAESILPDALQLMAANSRAGHIPSRALMLSARKEFGPLSDAIKKAGKEMITGKSLEESFMIIPRYIRSNILKRSMQLIISGTRSGGQFAELLEQNAEDIRRKQGITKEVRANVTMYVIFIGFAGCVGAPVLYALSTFLTVTISKLGSAATFTEEASSQVSFLQFSGIAVSPEFLFFFSLAAVLITTFFGGIIIGSIASGSEKAGAKYVPIFMIVGLLVFFAAQAFIQTSFGSLIP
ncbi:MAG: type II secretion system F family protein [Candidatus Aenigmarchaeota archaeon]|nr:type II secretion system F family protein [Candidatus Aenigmarchaeota archaeon]